MAVSEDRNRLNPDRNPDSELEQYGVWVKAGPEDVDESDAEDEAFALSDLGDEDGGELGLLGLDSELEDFDAPFADELDALDLDETVSELQSADDASVTGSPEDPTTEAPAGETADEDFLSLDEGELSLDIDETTDELGLDDSFDLTEPEPLAAEPVDETDSREPVSAEEPALSTEEPLDLESLEQDLDENEPLDLDSLDLESLEDEPLDLESLATEPEDEAATDDVEITEAGGIAIEDELPGDLDDLTLDLDSLDVDAYEEPAEGAAQTGEPGEPESETSAPDPPAQEPEDAFAASAAGDLEELDLEEEVSLDLDAASLNLDEDELNLDEDELTLDEDELDLDSLDLDPGVADLDLSSLPGDDEEFGAIADEELSQVTEDELPELESEEEFSLDETFDDLSAVEDEMVAPAREPEATANAAGDTSRTLLESIERELGSIRSELSDLKRELTQLRSDPHRVETDAEAELDAASGFFEDEGDDEDETIKLTGDELDNIMNTAEFTEETGQPTEYDELAGATHAVQTAHAGETAGEERRAEAEEHASIEEITLEEAPEDLGPLELDLSGLDVDEEEALEPEVVDEADLEASEDEIDTLASLDIDAELADIEELEDEESTPAPHERTETIGLDLVADESDEAEGPEASGIDAIDLTPPPGLDIDEPIPENLKGELRSVLNYMDQLLDALPEEKIQEFAASEHFKVYKRLFEELGLEQ